MKGFRLYGKSFAGRQAAMNYFGIEHETDLDWHIARSRRGSEFEDRYPVPAPNKKQRRYFQKVLRENGFIK